MGNLCFSTNDDRFGMSLRMPPERQVLEIIGRSRTHADEALRSQEVPESGSGGCRSSRLYSEVATLPVIREEEIFVSSPSRCESKETQDVREEDLEEEEVPCPVLLGRGMEEKVPAFMPGPAWKSAAGDSTIFLAAQAAAKSAKGISVEDQLRLYSLQKQGTVGPVRGPRPGLFEFSARAKWTAWAKLCSMDREMAKKEYCALVDTLVPGWRQDAQLEARERSLR